MFVINLGALQPIVVASSPTVIEQLMPANAAATGTFCKLMFFVVEQKT